MRRAGLIGSLSDRVYRSFRRGCCLHIEKAVEMVGLIGGERKSHGGWRRRIGEDERA
jgi:hypothetical protein